VSTLRFAFKALEVLIDADYVLIDVYLSPPKAFSLRPRSLAHGLALPQLPPKAFYLPFIYLTQVREQLFLSLNFSVIAQ
jgi:hypothetical protein